MNRITNQLSVCIPTYNGAKYLGEAISSVLEQTLSDFELIIVDDCSTDNTEAVIRSFSDNRIKYFKNPVRLGLVGNWNRCLELANGQYICIFHQDDVMMPDNLTEKIKILEEYPNVGLVHSNVLQIDPEGKLIQEGWVVNPPSDHLGVSPGLKFFKTMLLGPNIVSCPSVVARRVCYERVGGFDARLPFTTDWEMWLRLALFYDIGYLPQPLVKYRWHENNETHNFLGVRDLEHAHRAKMLVLEKYAEFIPDVEDLKAQVIKMHKQHVLDHILHHHRRREYDQAKQYLAFATDIYDDENGASPKDYRNWLLQIVDQMWQQDSIATSQLQLSPEAEKAKQSLWDPLIHQKIVNSLSSEDIAHEIPIRKLVKATGFKIGTKAGFRWLYRYLKNNSE